MSDDKTVASYSYRPANASHLPQLRKMMTALHQEHHTRDPELFKEPAEIDKVKDIGTYLNEPNCLLFVACDKHDGVEQVTGFISGHFCELSSTVSKPITMGSVDEFYVDPASRGQGIGRELLSIIAQRFKVYGASQMFVEVWDSNQGAIQMYQSSGFNHHIHWLRKPL